MKKVLLALAALLLVGLLGAGLGFWWLESKVSSPTAPGDSADVELVVPKGATGRSLGTALEDAGLVSDARLWRWLLWRRGGLAPKAGRHVLRRGMSPSEVAAALEQAPRAEDVPFAVLEGWRLRDTDAALAAKGWIRPGEYLSAASDPARYTARFPLPAGAGRTLEGYLYPETYRLTPERIDLAALVQRQLDTFAERVYLPHREELEGQRRSLHELVTMASLLEREEPTPSQRPLVAGILWKRLDRGINLGVDATSRYTLAEWNDRRAFLERLRDGSDPYNSRLRSGLPPSPIGAPTLESFLAALRPTKSEFLYYLHDAQRRLHPARDAAEHEANRKKYNVY